MTIFEIVSATLTSRADVEKCAASIIEVAKSEERQRISQILGHGIATDSLADALTLAFQSELGAADAIAIIDSKQSADCIRPH